MTGLRHSDLSRDYVSSRLAYCPTTGVFRWLRNPSASKQWNGHFVGKTTGSIDGHTGYARIRLDGRLLYAHHLAWLLVHGRWPENQIDHRNGCRADNRICNLRAAKRSENAQNAARRSDNKSGQTGVYLDGRSGRWAAEIHANGYRKHVGSFASIDEARTAYLAAKKFAHSFQPEPRSQGGDA